MSLEQKTKSVARACTLFEKGNKRAALAVAVASELHKTPFLEAHHCFRNIPRATYLIDNPGFYGRFWLVGMRGVPDTRDPQINIKTLVLLSRHCEENWPTPR